MLVPLEERGLCVIEDPPCDCPGYDEGYYASFFKESRVGGYRSTQRRIEAFEARDKGQVRIRYLRRWHFVAHPEHHVELSLCASIRGHLLTDN